METNKIDTDDLIHDLTHYCLDMIKYIYRIDTDNASDNDLHRINRVYCAEIRDGISRVIRDIEKRLNEDELKEKEE